MLKNIVFIQHYIIQRFTNQKKIILSSYLLSETRTALLPEKKECEMPAQKKMNYFSGSVTEK